jgi:hypothetical protein
LPARQIAHQVPNPKSKIVIRQSSIANRQSQIVNRKSSIVNRFMRIAEIAVIGSGRKERDAFIQSVCQKLELANDNVTFGRLPINDQLVLHLYGVAASPNGQAPAWDLIAKKMLGCVALFAWQDAEAFERLKPAVDYLASRYETPMVVAAHLAGVSQPLPPALRHEGITLTAEGQLAFCDVRNPASVRKILALLIDSLLAKMP